MKTSIRHIVFLHLLEWLGINNIICYGMGAGGNDPNPYKIIMLKGYYRMLEIHIYDNCVKIPGLPTIGIYSADAMMEYVDPAFPDTLYSSKRMG